MPIAERRTQEQRRTETRARLLDAAADLFARKGFHATSAEAVAGAAGRTTGALYDHFGGKDGVLLALVDRWMSRTVAELAAELETIGDLDGRLSALWAGTAGTAGVIGDPDDAWVLLEFELWLQSVRNPELADAAARRFHMARRSFAEGLTAWADEFAFTLPGPAADVASRVIALVLGAAFQHRLEPAVMTAPVVVDGLRQLLGLPTNRVPTTISPAPASPAEGTS